LRFFGAALTQAIADVVKGAPVVPWIPAGLFPTVAVTFILLGLFFAVLFLKYVPPSDPAQSAVERPRKR